ncbi:MAG: hypothetical protein IIA51_08335 [Chloroflexi bacterium]|nr:hypothetical protein [Chloroflexota bacterium]MCH8341545.1 hypothetical protein [Chloroflexota bacterium]
MRTSSGFPLTGGLMNSTVALLGWFGLSSGIYAILTDAMVEGLVWIVVTLGLSTALLKGKAIAESENREVPGILWLFIALVMAVLGATRLFNLTITDIEQLGSLQIPELFQDIASVIYLIVLAIFLWQLIFAYRQRRNA